MYDGSGVAKYIINYSNKEKYNISNLKLQKILYYIQGAFVVYKGEECYYNELKQWKHGPVIPSIYREYKFFGNENIVNIEEEVNILNDNFELESVKIDSYINENDKELINDVVDSLSHFSAWELVEKTHEEEPWKKTDSNKTIEIEKIKTYFMSNKGRLFGLEK